MIEFIVFTTLFFYAQVIVKFLFHIHIFCLKTFIDQCIYEQLLSTYKTYNYQQMYRWFPKKEAFNCNYMQRLYISHTYIYYC